MNEAKKRIALAVTLSEIGGVQIFLLEFAQYLKNLGHEVTIMSGPGDWLANQAAARGIEFIRLKHMRRDIHPWHDTLAIFELANLFRKGNYDAVHLNSSKMGVIGSIASRLPRTVYRIGGWVFLENLPTWKKQVYIAAERFTARFKDTIICVHPGDVETAKQIGIKPKKNIVVVPNGIDLPRFESKLQTRDHARALLDIRTNAFVIGSISNFYAPKNIPAYLDTIRAAVDQNPNLHFVIIGDGQERGLIEKKIFDLNLQNSITLTGEHTDASTLLRAFDLFVLPSTKEGMSWALLEAMAAALPCIATDVGAAKWMLAPEAGFVVPPSDDKALSNAILFLASNPSERVKLGQNAKEAVQNRFPLEKTLSENASALLN